MDKHGTGTNGHRLVSFPVYTIGDTASGVFSVLPSILLMYYMTNILAISPPLATVAVFVPKMVDLVINPLIGSLSDRTRTRLGRRRPFMLVSAATIFPSFAVIWLAPFPDPVHSAYFILAMFSLCTVAFGCFIVPFFALNTELARTYHERTALNAYRTVYTFVGAILAGAVAPLLIAWGGGGRRGYEVMGLITAAIMTATVLVTFATAREPERHGDDHPPTWRETTRAIATNRPFQVLLAGYCLYITSAGLISAVLAYFITYVLGRGTEFLSLAFLATYGSAIVGIPVWSALSKRIGKLKAIRICLCLSACAALGQLFVDRNTPVAFILMLVGLAGAAGGGIQVFSFSMLADCINHGAPDGEQAGSEAVLTGIFIAAEKLGFAAGALIGGIIFTVTGLIATSQGATHQPEEAILGIRLAMSVAPALVQIAVAALLGRNGSFERRVMDFHRHHLVPAKKMS